tara:strand:- start:1372 stop:1551 length:180 start_codon:yes stop_codon:yes gene_type:complete
MTELNEMKAKLDKSLTDMDKLQVRTTGANLRQKALIVEAITWVSREIENTLVRDTMEGK